MPYFNLLTTALRDVVEISDARHVVAPVPVPQNALALVLDLIPILARRREDADFLLGGVQHTNLHHYSWWNNERNNPYPQLQCQHKQPWVLMKIREFIQLYPRQP